MPRVAVLVSYSGDGGVERMMNHVIAGLLEAGHAVDVIVLRTEGGHFAALPAGANLVRLGTRHASLAVGPLARHLRRTQPSVLLAAKDRAGRAAVRARARARVSTRVVVRIGNTLSQSLAGRSRLRRQLRYALVRRLYRRADAIVAVSRGVAADVVAISGVAPERVHVVPNPVVTADIQARARECPDHPWLRAPGPPLIVGIGRLTRQKDFPTLLRAFARVRSAVDCRLLVLGEGEDRGTLTALGRRLGIGADLDLPGFVDNPYGYLARADLFVLSSAWEGSPNALAEALALGIPVVATDCRSGPRELLADGRFGPLIPVGDFDALADAMMATLRAPLPEDALRGAVAGHTQAASLAGYLAVLGLHSSPADQSC